MITMPHCAGRIRVLRSRLQGFVALRHDGIKFFGAP